MDRICIERNRIPATMGKACVASVDRLAPSRKSASRRGICEGVHRSRQCRIPGEHDSRPPRSAPIPLA
eukprot:2107538-Pleurochrysis_carterae.AAC.1